MLKKLIIVSSAAAVVTLGWAGVASAGEPHHGDGGTNCTANDTTKQHNKGHQLVGGNLSAQDLNGNVLGAQATRPAGICPSIANNNDL